MERTLPLRTDGSAAASLGIGLLRIVPLLGLFAWHGWLTLSLFGCENRWQQLLDDRPIISGRHAFHLYHARLGAQSFRERGTLCCFDAAFQAGYPKTPVFDEGARPGELFLTLARGGFRRCWPPHIRSVSPVVACWRLCCCWEPRGEWV